MALSETAKLVAQLTLDDKMSKGIKGAERNLGSLGKTAKTVGKGIAVGLGAVAVGGMVVLGGAIRSGIEALREDKLAAAQTAAVLKSTGAVAGLTAKNIEDLAASLSDLNGIQDDVVQGAENVFLTFTAIGKKVFPRATQAAIDMAAALGSDPSSAAQQLGRALQDPIKGMARLARQGILFTAAEKKRIQTLVTQNRLEEAQAIILGKVETKYKGVAAAQADADPGRRLALGVEKLQKALATTLLPVVEKVQRRLTEWMIRPETLATVRKIGEAISGLMTDENLNTVATALETGANAVSGAISLFNKLPPEIKALAIGALAVNKVTGGAVGGAAEAFGKLIGAGLKQIFAANVTVIGTNVVSPGGGGPSIPGAIATGAGAAGAGAAVTAGLVAGAIAVPLGSIAWQLGQLKPSTAGANIGPGGQKGGFTTAGKGGVFFVPSDPVVQGVNATKTAVERVGSIVRDGDRTIAGNAATRMQAVERSVDRSTTTARSIGDNATSRLAAVEGAVNRAKSASAATGARTNSTLAAIRAKRTKFDFRIPVTTTVSIRSVIAGQRTVARTSRTAGAVAD